MAENKRFLVDVGVRDLPFPITVASRDHPNGQPTVANISVSARIYHEFEARWIDRFIQTIHKHQGEIRTRTLKNNIRDYLKVLDATSVRVDFDYPFFIEKRTPASKEACLVKYQCRYSARITSTDDEPRVSQRVIVPIITTYPASNADREGGLFGQLTNIQVDIESSSEVHVEEVVDKVEAKALSPVYSFLTEEDQAHVIHIVHTREKSSVVVTDEISESLASDPAITWYSLKASNFGMLHNYSTIIGTETTMMSPSGPPRKKQNSGD